MGHLESYMRIQWLNEKHRNIWKSSFFSPHRGTLLLCWAERVSLPFHKSSFSSVHVNCTTAASLSMSRAPHPLHLYSMYQTVSTFMLSKHIPSPIMSFSCISWFVAQVGTRHLILIKTSQLICPKMRLNDKANCGNIKVLCKLQMAADFTDRPLLLPHWAVSVTMYEQIFMAFYATMDLELSNMALYPMCKHKNKWKGDTYTEKG